MPSGSEGVNAVCMSSLLCLVREDGLCNSDTEVTVFADPVSPTRAVMMLLAIPLLMLI